MRFKNPSPAFAAGMVLAMLKPDIPAVRFPIPENKPRPCIPKAAKPICIFERARLKRSSMAMGIFSKSSEARRAVSLKACSNRLGASCFCEYIRPKFSLTVSARNMFLLERRLPFTVTTLGPTNFCRPVIDLNAGMVSSFAPNADISNSSTPAPFAPGASGPPVPRFIVASGPCFGLTMPITLVLLIALVAFVAMVANRPAVVSSAGFTLAASAAAKLSHAAPKRSTPLTGCSPSFAPISLAFVITALKKAIFFCASVAVAPSPLYASSAFMTIPRLSNHSGLWRPKPTIMDSIDEAASLPMARPSFMAVSASLPISRSVTGICNSMAVLACFINSRSETAPFAALRSPVSMTLLLWPIDLAKF